MPLQSYVKQLRPRDETYVPHVDKIQSLLRELTISPFYQQKGTFNPYSTVDVKFAKTVATELPEKEYDELLFKSVESGKGKMLLDGGGKFEFQLVLKRKNNEIETDYYIKSPKKYILSHYGMKQRKDSTASSNVNEYLSMYFLAHPKFTDAESFMQDVARLSGGTGVYTGEDKDVTYEELVVLIDKDESAIRDINIGFHNSLSIKK